jgi:hypothetical protein
MQLQAGMRWVQLEIECRRFHSLLFLASEFGEAVSESVRDSEFHAPSSSLFRTKFLQHLSTAAESQSLGIREMLSILNRM